MQSRRDVLKSWSLLALSPAVPGFLARTARAAAPGRDGRVLVVIQLDGGNDGINTVVPFADEGYAKHRKTLRLPANRLVKINDTLGLHPSLSGFGQLMQTGQLAIVQGVGYPNPSRSHFQSMATWHTARLDAEEHKSPGWLGRGLDATGGEAPALLVGAGSPPAAIRGRRSAASAIERLDDFIAPAGVDSRKALQTDSSDELTAFVRRSMLDAYATADQLTRVLETDKEDARYPPTGLAARLRLVARLLKAGTGTRIYYTVQPGYDTHSNQLYTHSTLLNELSGAVKAFLDDLGAAKLAERAAVLVFSEFGRTVSENNSRGTDHGTAAPVFLAGPAVKGGVTGATPSLLDLDPQHGDLRRSLDFRQIYATVLENWLGLPAREALAAEFERLPLFRS
jgi:uncharacterized protein (DUF1501 family)